MSAERSSGPRSDLWGSKCSSPRRLSIDERSCAAWAPRSRCRCSTRWSLPASRSRRRAASPLRRLGFVYMPNGVARNFTGINYWTPVGEGTNFELSQILTPLAPYRDRLTVISGLAQHQADAFDDGANGDHTRGTSSWLSGVHCKRTEGADVKNGITADQIAAAEIGKTTALPSLELAHRSQLPRRAVREQLQLRVPEHALVALRRRRRCPPRTIRASCSSGCSATAARRRSGWRRRA